MSDLTDSLHLGVVEYEKRWSGDCHADKGGPVDYEATLKIMVEAADRIADLEAENTALKDQLAGKWLPIESAPENQLVNVRRFNKISNIEDTVVLLLRHVKALGDPIWISAETGKEVSLSAWKLLDWSALPPAPKGPDA